MRISGTNGTGIPGGQALMAPESDAVTRNLQKQIETARKKLQELSSDENMSLEEKMKKRQEINQQITDLNNQLKQHQIERRREKQQKKESSMDDMFGGKTDAAEKSGNQAAGLSQSSMKAMISADNAVEQAQVQGRTAGQLEGRAGVLEIEIKLDSARGSSVDAKKKELARVEQAAKNASASQMDTLNKANEELKEAQKEEGDSDNSGKAQKTSEKRTDGEPADSEKPLEESPEEDLKSGLKQHNNGIDVRI